ncbi:toll/interleukin-1 receptor domain-containing protein [Streptomyces sp. NPDC014861]|uniref:toll/interleukin-1 receptor domain-containing protein n=1 Tax=Streptomyces sp. NPDC014861 TaxID=3364923 RepID=UPI0036FBD595
MAEIFINYRTGDGNEVAALLDEALCTRFGDDAVFYSGRSGRAGEPYPRALLTAVRRSSVLLAVIGPDWADHPGLRREDDWVRIEILEAWRCGVHVVPVLRGRRTERLSPSSLPSELAPLAELNSLRIDSQSHVEGTAAIGDAIVQLVPGLAAPHAEPDGADDVRSTDTTQNALAGGNSGFSIQSRDIGRIDALVTNPTGPVNTGSGTQNNQSHTHQPHMSGDGAAYVAGENHGGISHRFGRTERDEADGR